MSDLKRFDQGYNGIEPDKNGSFCDYIQAADLIEQLQQRIVELERDCNSEHYHRRAVDEENQHLKQRNSELSATVEQLRESLSEMYDYAYHEEKGLLERGVSVYQKDFELAKRLLEETQQQSLAERDANLIDKITSRIVDCREMELSQGDKDTILLIAQRIKDGK